jgi:hypothetical protein
VAKGLVGLFFIPLRILKPSLIVFLWSLGLSIGALILAWGVLLAVLVRSTDEEVRRSRFLLWLWLTGGTLASAVPVYLLFKAQYFAAGKGFSMLFPFAFVVICLPIITKQAPIFQMYSWSVVAGHLILGIARPIAVGLNPLGQFYGSSYMQLRANLSADYDWDIGKHSADFDTCRLVRIEIDQPHLERAVQLYLMEKGVQWFSLHEQYRQYGRGPDLGKMLAPDGQVEDCVIADHNLPTPSPARLILLSVAK